MGFVFSNELWLSSRSCRSIAVRAKNSPPDCFLNALTVLQEIITVISKITALTFCGCCFFAVLFTFGENYGIIQLIDKLEFVRIESMIVLITGASHTGKTALAQKLLEKYK